MPSPKPKITLSNINYRQSPKFKFMSNIFLIFYRLFYRHLHFSFIKFVTQFPQNLQNTFTLKPLELGTEILR